MNEINKIKPTIKMILVLTYSYVGLISTVTTISTIYILTYLSIYIFWTNLIGYLIGFIVNFFLNSKLTFRKDPSLPRFMKFTVSCVLSYLVNLLIIYLILKTNSSYLMISQGVGMVVYTLTNYTLNKIWVMI
jgi:putative flippase GtrA